MNIAVIPARGGSKRIPKKNIKLFHGKPIIAYSIEAAILSSCFDKIIVSTDDPEIARISKLYGAEVPFLRPAHISDDYSTTLDVVEHALNWFIKKGWNIKAVCCIYATAPFLLPDDLKKGYSLISQENINFSFSATTFSFPIQRAIKLDKHCNVSMFYPENEFIRSQDLEECYHDAGQFYWGVTSAYLKKMPIFSSYSKAVVLPRNRVQDIDTLEDWNFAEKLFRVNSLLNEKSNF